MLVGTSIYAQSPQKMSYQAVLRNATNEILSLHTVSIRLSILQNDNVVYMETHLPTTNINGLITLQIGAGATLAGKFSSIDWSKGPFFVKTETDPDGGFNYSIVGTTELLSVPFAFYALSSKSTFDTTSIDNRLTLASTQIEFNRKQILSNIDSINTKINSVDAALLLLDYQKLGKFVSSISLEGNDIFDIKINGNLLASKNVTVGGNIESSGSTSTLGTLEKPFKGLYISSGSLSIASDTLGKNIPAAVLSNVEGNLQISSGGLELIGKNSSFIAPRIVSTLTGNASTATKLDTARTINGVAFDGSKDIVLPEIDHDSAYVKTGQLNGTDSFNILMKGNLGASGNVTVAGNIEALGSTSTLGTNEKPFKGLFISSGSLSIASDTLGKNVPAAILSNIEGNLQISAGGLKLMGENTSFISPRIVSTLTGNASTATKLDTARTINGVAFDGTSDILISTAAANALTYTNTGAGDLPGGNYDGSIAKTISYNSIGASPLAGSNQITSVGNLSVGSIPYTLLSGTIPTWNQSTLGNAATVTTNANLTGVVTSIGNVTSIAAGAITNTMIANPAVASLSGTNTGDQTNIAGNAATATKLAASKLINGVAFDGTSDILISTASANSLTYTNTGAGELPGGNYDGSIAKTISYNSIGASPLAGSNQITSVGTLSVGSIPYTLLSGTVPTWNQSTLGNAATVTTNANLTGVVTSIGNVTSIAAGAITNTMIANPAVASLSGTNTGDQILPTLISLGAVASNVAITGATKTKLTYDAKGLVTAGTDATTADIAASTNKNYVTDAQAGVISNTSGVNTGDQINITGNSATVTTNASLTGGVTSVGNAATVITNANLTGVVTSIGNVTSIAAGVITNTMIANPAVASLSGTNTGDQILPTLISLGAVASNVAITGATKTKLTYDAKGLVTAGTDATTADIAASTNKNYVTDAQAGVISNTTGTNTGDETVTTIKSKLGITTLTGSNTGDQINITGNAATVTTNANLTGGVTSVGNATTVITNANLTGGVTSVGNAATVVTNANLTGVVTSVGNVTSIAAGAITNTMIANPAVASLSGTNSGDETVTTIKSKLSITTLTGSNTGDQTNITGNAATVTTNANLTGGVTSVGNAATVVTNANLSGDVSSVGNTTTIGLLKVTNAMIAATTIDLTAKVTGTLPIANGGTNSIATPTAGGINYGTGTAQAYTAVGTSGQFLQSAAGAAPVWAQPGPTSVQVLTSLTPASTYTTPAGVKAIMVELIGGGGGGGGAVVAASQRGTAAGGGGSGTYTRILIVNPASSYLYTIGIAGTAGTVAGGNGGTGGASSFNNGAITAPGGTGGVGCLAQTGANGGALKTLGGTGGAAGIGGNISRVGEDGGTGFVTTGISLGGKGSSSFYGSGGESPVAITTQTIAGVAATGYGAGASGAAVYFAAAAAGAAGFQGVIIVTEYK